MWLHYNCGKCGSWLLSAQKECPKCGAKFSSGSLAYARDLEGGRTALLWLFIVVLILANSRAIIDWVLDRPAIWMGATLGGTVYVWRRVNHYGWYARTWPAGLKWWILLGAIGAWGGWKWWTMIVEYADIVRRANPRP